VRIRRAWKGEGAGAKTRIDWPQLQLVKDDPQAVASAIKPELASLRELKLPDGTPVWFNAKEARGPLRVPDYYKVDGVRSAFALGPATQYVSSTPEEVAATIKDGGGTALPIPTDSAFSALIDMFGVIKQKISPTPVWDDGRLGD
jgi:hypothetical protein